MALDYKITISAINTGLRRTVEDTRKAFGDLGSELGTIRAAAGKLLAVGGIGAAIGGAGGAVGVITLARSVSQAAKEVSVLAGLSGTGFEEFQRYAYGARQLGVEQDKLADIFKDVQDKIGDFLVTGGGPLADFFENVAPKVGVTAEQFRRLSGPQALELYFSSLEKANLSQSQMVFYMEAIASDATALIPLLRDNAKGFRDAATEADRLGIVMSRDLVEQGKELERNIAQLEALLRGFGITIGGDIVPALNDLAGALMLVSADANDLQQGDGLTTWADRGADAVAFLVDVLDGAWRVLEIMGTGLGGYAAMFVQVMEGNLKGARDTFDQIGKDVDAILQRQQFSDALDEARQKRVSGQAKLNSEIERLEGELQKKLQSQRNATDNARKVSEKEQLAGAVRVRDALRAAWQASVDGAKEAKKAAEELRKEADASASNYKQQAQARRDQDLSPEERDATLTKRASNLTDEATRQSTFAQNAALGGRAKEAQRYAEKAAELIKQAADAANQIGDNETAAKLLDRLGEADKDRLAAQAKLKDQEAENLKAQAELQQAEWQKAVTQLEELRAKAEFPLKIDTTQANAEIAALSQRLAELKAQAGGAVSTDVASAAALPARGGGGVLPGDYRGDASDHIVYRGTPGEFITRLPVVRQPGALTFLRRFNAVGMQALREQLGGHAYATGGVIGEVAAQLGRAPLNGGANIRELSSSNSGATQRPLVLDFGALGRVQVNAASADADSLVKRFRRASLAAGAAR